jgi:hypothetical protein
MTARHSTLKVVRAGFVIPVCVMIFSLGGSPARAHPQFTNEPAGSTQYFECDFNGTLCGMNSVYNTEAYASPGGGGQISPPMALDEYMLAGANTGNGQWGLTFPRKQEIFVGFVWSTTVNGFPNNNNKLIFIKDPSNSFLVWQGLPGAPKTLKWYQQEYVDNSQATGCGNWGNLCYNTTRDGTGWFEPNAGGNATIAAGSGFHKVEIYLKASTTPSSADGIVRVWVDGALTTNYTNVNQGHNGDPNSGFGNVEITSTWDGQFSPSSDWHHYFDHLYVSFPNCPDGCPVTGNTGGSGGGGGTTDITPPPMPEAEGCPPVPDMKIRSPQNSAVPLNLGKACKNGYEIFGLPPICSLSAGTYDAGRDTWDLTSGDAAGLTVSCPNFCGKMEFTVIPKNDP